MTPMPTFLLILVSSAIIFHLAGWVVMAITMLMEIVVFLATLTAAHKEFDTP